MLVSLAALLSIGGGASAQQYAPMSVALPGDTAPSTNGETYTNEFSLPQIDWAGDVVFIAGISNGYNGVFMVDSAGNGHAIALDGETAPGTGGAATYGRSARTRASALPAT